MSATTQKKSRHMTFSIQRYNPLTDKKPYMQEFKLNTADFHSVMLLDALEAIKAQHDESLSFRRSCGEGVCGSDGLNINGKNSLACITQLVNLPDHVVLKALPGMPIVRDLVVDMSQFYAQYEKGQPYLQNNEVEPAKEHLQSPAERAKLDGLYECILCACCTSACPSYWWNPDKFMGPAALLWVCRFIMDSRDTSAKRRLELLQDAFSLFRCRTIMDCTDACPKGLNPAAAIGEIRRKMLEEAT